MGRASLWYQLWDYKDKAFGRFAPWLDVANASQRGLFFGGFLLEGAVLHALSTRWKVSFPRVATFLSTGGKVRSFATRLPKGVGNPKGNERRPSVASCALLRLFGGE